MSERAATERAREALATYLDARAAEVNKLIAPFPPSMQEKYRDAPVYKAIEALDALASALEDAERLVALLIPANAAQEAELQRLEETLAGYQ